MTQKVLTKLLLFLTLVLVIYFLPAQETDWRNIRNGLVIPDEAYSDQPYIIQADDGAWLCAMTTGSGHEGAGGQHIITQRSFDQGKTWIDRVAVEPSDGPEASYSVMLKTPSGRIFIFYNHNTDNVRQILGEDSSTVFKRVDSQGYFVFKYSDDHGKTWSKKRITIPVREFEIDKKNIYQGKIRFFWNVGKAFVHEGQVYVPLVKVGGLGDGFFTRNEGVLLVSKDLLHLENPAKAIWKTLPKGDIGLRTPPGGGPISAEHSYSVLSDGSFFCVYRSLDGHPVYTYSRDRGHNWDIPIYLEYADGRFMKHPRAANFAWKCKNGKYLYWFHNHGGRFIREHPQRSRAGYKDRNPVWISGGIEMDGPNGKIIKWTQPEILLYDDDPIIRMSYPDFLEYEDTYFFTETQKDVARVHKVEKKLLEGLWNQFEKRQKVTEGLAREWNLANEILPVKKKSVPLRPFYVSDPNRQDLGGKSVPSGFTIDVKFVLNDLNPGQVLLDTRNEFGKGIWVLTSEEGTISITLSDGRSVSTWACDKGSVQAGREHFMSIIVDGGPKIVMFIIDGILNDGGSNRPFGWGRFNPYLQEVNGAENWNIGYNISGIIERINIYNRALTVSEAIGNFRFYSEEP